MIIILRITLLTLPPTQGIDFNEKNLTNISGGGLGTCANKSAPLGRCRRFLTITVIIVISYLLPPFLPPTSYLPPFLPPTFYFLFYLLPPFLPPNSYLLPPFLPSISLSTSYLLFAFLPQTSLSTPYLLFYLLPPFLSPIFLSISYLLPPFLPCERHGRTFFPEQAVWVCWVRFLNFMVTQHVYLLN